MTLGAVELLIRGRTSAGGRARGLRRATVSMVQAILDLVNDMLDLASDLVQNVLDLVDGFVHDFAQPVTLFCERWE
ncbi:hypothetical protein Rhopal_001137-T1 [Rhodotorula paludigena]|uniref:Uncharacterized protein n=1 Tax=Rhodotorula paludigena TaxID=86838 RepID=A0AAV5GFP9_9BASI|nr:hypothetical protein Rhopal_001137-T1 [Rhodotorula paludigena]